MRPRDLLPSGIGGATPPLDRDPGDMRASDQIERLTSRSLSTPREQVSGFYHAGDARWGTPDEAFTTRLTRCISQAATDGKAVIVPEDMLPYASSNVTFDTDVRMVAEGQDHGNYTCEAYGGSPSNTGAANTAALQAAWDAAVAQGGGLVTMLTPGTWDLDEVGTNPYEGANRYCIDLGDNQTANTTIYWGAGVTVQLADDQQTDANGPVDVIVGRDITGFALRGAGRGVTRFLGNTSGQTNWTGGYAQQSNGRGLKLYTSAGNGCNHIRHADMESSDFFSNPLDIGKASAISRDIVVERTEHVDCGEGPLFLKCNDVIHRDFHVQDDAGVFVGDGWEVSECDGFVAESFEIIDVTSGSAVDLFGSKNGRVDDYLIDGCTVGFDFGTTGGGVNVEDVVVGKGIFTNGVPTGGAFRVRDGDDPRGCSVEGMVIRNTSLMFQVSGTGSEPFVVKGLTGDSGGQVRGGAWVEFHGGTFDGDGTQTAPIDILNVDTGGPPHVFGRDLSVDGYDHGVQVDGQGSAFNPTGSIRSNSFKNLNTTTIFNTKGSGTFDNIVTADNDLDNEVIDRVSDASGLTTSTHVLNGEMADPANTAQAILRVTVPDGMVGRLLIDLMLADESHPGSSHGYSTARLAALFAKEEGSRGSTVDGTLTVLAAADAQLGDGNPTSYSITQVSNDITEAVFDIEVTADAAGTNNVEVWAEIDVLEQADHDSFTLAAQSSGLTLEQIS